MTHDTKVIKDVILVRQIRRGAWDKFMNKWYSNETNKTWVMKQMY